MFRRNIRITASDWFVIAQITLFCYTRCIEVDFFAETNLYNSKAEKTRKIAFWTRFLTKIAHIDFFEKSKKTFLEEVY